MTLISSIGTAAMLWVGGNIIVHGLHNLGWHLPYETIHHFALMVSQQLPTGQAFVEWLVTAAADGVIGLVLGLALIPVTKLLLLPTVKLFRKAG